MKLLDVKVYPGRNIYAHFPVIRIEVDLKKYADIPTCCIEGFNQKLLEKLPGLKMHKCSVGEEGGFAKRLQKGTYLAHVMEHISLEIQNMLGYSVNYGKAMYFQNESIYCIVYSYINKVIGVESGKLAFDIIKSILNGSEIDINIKLKNMANKAMDMEIGPSTKAILDEAKKRNIPFMQIGENSLFQLGYGKYGRKIQATITDATSCIAVDTAGDKALVNHILKTRRIPVPECETVNCFKDAAAAAKKIGFPVVIKPFNGNQGKGVFINLNSFQELKKAFCIAKKFSDKVMVEKFVYGKNYRIIVIGEKVPAVSQRVPAHVIGNGNNTLKELIDIENKNPLRGEGHEKPLTKIKVDDVMLFTLEKNGLTLNSIPEEGKFVFLRENDNLSTGGTSIDVTDEIHPLNIKIAVEAVRAIGLDIAGVDVITPEISRPIIEDGGSVIEINACPGIRMHHHPTEGECKNVAKEIVDLMFPEGSKFSVPIISITGTNGKTTTTRMIAKILMKNQLVVGMTSTDGVYIQNEKIMEGDATGVQSAQAVLSDKRVEAAVLETARGGIINKGLGYDIADIGIITNISDDHLGLDGINSVEEMAHVKSLVVEAVKKDGYAVLNAEDPLVKKITETVKCKIIYFGKKSDNPLLQKQIKDGGKAVYLKNEKIYIYDGLKETFLMPVKDIPAALNGILEHNIENSLAAAAGAHGLGIDAEVIRNALKTFDSDIVNNPGRFNIFDLENFKVVVDYGHNIDGYHKVISGLKKMKANRLIGVIGMPGDRTDINILKTGELCGKYFDYVYIKEDENTRGRKVKETAKILKKGCMLGGLNENQIETILCETTALKEAMKNARNNDIITVFYEKYHPVIQVIEEYKKNRENVESELVKIEGMKIAAKTDRIFI